MSESEMKRLSLADVRALAKEKLASVGVDERGSDNLADLIMCCERDGPRSHGLMMLPHYMQAFSSGYAKGDASPSIEQIAPAILRGDGDNGYFQLASELARPRLVQLARKHGIAGFTCSNIHHLSALRFETEPLAEQGLIAFCFVNSLALIVPHGGDKPIFGTNPMSFACPREGVAPIVWDQASSVVALMDIKLAATEGHALPVYGGLDHEGQPSKDAKIISETLSLLPFAEHKGTGIALMVEILAAALSGSLLSTQTEEKDSFGALNIKAGVTTFAIDPAKWGNPLFLAQVEQIAQSINKAPGARVPGDGRLKKRAEALANGVLVNGELLARLSI
ncbi:MAG: Ldh family oxidoreductase [Cohaesibacter sp.]|nr:Ldh family oxidoreductase [Cohaesibacter sp.]